ncbi:hypothetical protein [Promicromonospora aerolata]|uniref:Excreted virulence factor EspC (Type VII ESX diderm) n=1 Tax=Promicromonospora aerolata TaxID=195749 RepID=A0ABW4V8M0_9MICO
MGGELLKIDLAEVDTTSEKLSFIAENLRGAVNDAATVAAMIPHDGLAGCVEKFGDDWNKAREEIIGKVEAAHAAGEQIFRAFTDVDAELAGAMERS